MEYQKVLANIAIWNIQIFPMNEKKININISHQLVKAREELGLTQKQVEQSGIIKQSNLSKFENGLSIINASKLFMLSNFYNKPITFFFKNEK